MDDGASATNDALVRAFIAAWERRDTEFIVNCFADDGVYHSISLTPIVGRQAIRDLVRGFEGKPAGQLEILHQVATSNLVMNERVDRLTLNGTGVTLPTCGVG